MKVDKEELRRLHAEGWTDRQMRDRFKVRHSTIVRLRDGLGLPRNPSIARGPQALKEADLRALYAAGYCDLEIAAQLGVSTASVHRWRRRLIGLPPNPVPGERRRIAEENARRSRAGGTVGTAVRRAFGLYPADPRILTMLEAHVAEAMRAAP